MACLKKTARYLIVHTTQWLAKMATLLIRFYQYAISPLLGTNCRFYPSCSSYNIAAIETHGLLKGGYLGIKRILKCHPWHPGGVDPVPKCCAFHHHQKDTETSNQKHSGSIT